MKSTYTIIGYARGLTVLMMPAVHAVLFYGSPSVYDTWLVYLLRFFAEGPGAQLFMFIMGFFISLKSPGTRKLNYQRGCQLFLAGYGLSLVRLYLPAKLGWLPPELIARYTVVVTKDIFLPLLITGDILQFAGISYVLVSLVQRTIQGFLIPVLLYGIVAFITPFCRGIHASQPEADYLLGLFFAEDNRAFFPVFPWLCYPLAGYIAGNVFRQLTEPAFYSLLLKIGFLLLSTGMLIERFGPPFWELDFYRSGPGMTLTYTGFQMLWICFLRICANYLPTVSLWKRLLLFCNRRITAIYLIHWVIIGWSVGWIGYQQLEIKAVYLALVIISLLSFGTTYLLRDARYKRT